MSRTLTAAAALLLAALSAQAQPAGPAPAGETPAPPAAEAPAPGPEIAPPAPATASPATGPTAGAPSTHAALPQPAFPAADEARAGWESPGPSESLLGSLLKMLLVLGVVLATIYLTLNVGLRRLLKIVPPREAAVQVHERVPLDGRKSVWLVEAGGEYMLLGSGDHEVRFLTRLDAEAVRGTLARRAAKGAAASRPFWERLSVKPAPTSDLRSRIEGRDIVGLPPKDEPPVPPKGS